MSNSTTEIVIGMDISDKKSEICVLGHADGKVQRTGQVENSLYGLVAGLSFIEEPSRTLVAMEAGQHSPWISAFLEDQGFQVIVGNPRKMRFIWKSDNKSDRRDAEMLARTARFDRELFYPIRHKSRESQAVLCGLKARDALIKSRTQLINSVRGLLKSMGYAAPSCSSRAFAAKLLAEMPEIYHAAVKDILEVIDQISGKLDAYDRRIEKVSREKYPETEILKQIKGVGPLTSLAFVLTVEDPGRFAKSRHVGPYLGLVPKRDQSGETERQLGITKAGDQFLRKLLVQCAQYIMGPFGDDCELRRFGERIAARGGKAAKKKAVVAVARKLGIKMHRLWADRAEYDPFYHRNKKMRKLKKTA